MNNSFLIKFIISFLLIFFGAHYNVSANDYNSELGAGGLLPVQSNTIAMDREDLFLSKEEVRVRYEFRNVTSLPVTTRVAFPMPEVPHMDGGGPTTSGGEYNVAVRFPVTNPNFLNFKVWVNQLEIRPKLEIRARLPNGRDISAALLDIGGMALMMRPGVFGREEFNGAYGPIDENTRLRLSQLGAYIVKPDEADRYELPWTVYITFHWEQEFPPGITVIEHHYKPLVGGGLMSFTPQGGVILAGLDSYEKDFCVDASTARRIRQLGQQNGRRPADHAGGTSVLRYILQTARSWHGPIGRFHLTIQGSAESRDLHASITSLCTDLPLHRTGPQRFEATVENYIPAADLRILFLDLPK